MKFADIPQFPQSYYQVNVEFNRLYDSIERWSERDSPVILNPEWQRGHVWSVAQQERFVEYFLKGGRTGRDIYFNCSSWMDKYNTPIYCVDGLQRITAMKEFVDNNIKAFGCYYNEFEDSCGMVDNTFVVHMLKLKSKRDLLQVYVDFNSGGTPHNPKEIDRVKKMLEESGMDETI